MNGDSSSLPSSRLTRVVRTQKTVFRGDIDGRIRQAAPLPPPPTPPANLAKPTYVGSDDPGLDAGYDFWQDTSAAVPGGEAVTPPLHVRNPRESPDSPGVTTTLVDNDVGVDNMLMGEWYFYDNPGELLPGGVYTDYDNYDQSFFLTECISTSNASRAFDLDVPVGTLKQVMPVVHARLYYSGGNVGSALLSVGLVKNDEFIANVDLIYAGNFVADNIGAMTPQGAHTVASVIADIQAGGVTLRADDFSTTMGNIVRIYELWLEMEFLDTPSPSPLGRLKVNTGTAWKFAVPTVGDPA